MSALTPTAQFTCDDRSGRHFIITEVFYNATGDTVIVAAGVTTVVAMVTSGTAPAATATAISTGDSVALTGGTTGQTVFVVSFHAGRNTSGLGSV